MSVASIVMATYNTPEAYLREAISSIINQSYADFELIIIDDGSTQNDVQVISEFCDPRICLLKNEQNMGLAYSLNRGLAAARGKYIVRMDSDDIALKHRLETQIAFMESHEDVDILGARAECFGNRCGLAIIDYGADNYVKAALFFTDLILHPTVVMRRDSLTRFDLTYDETLRRAQDYDLWVRAAEVCRLHIMPDVVLQYRCHEKQATVVDRKKQLDVCRTVNGRYLNMMGIPVTEETLNLQRALSGSADEKIAAGQLKDYVLRLSSANKEKCMFDTDIFEEMLRTKLVYSVIKLAKQHLLQIQLRDIPGIFSVFNISMVVKHRNRNNVFLSTYCKTV